MRLSDDRFQAEIEDGRFLVARGSGDKSDAIFDSDAATLRAVVFGGRALTEAVQSGDLHLEGNREAAARS